MGIAIAGLVSDARVLRYALRARMFYRIGLTLQDDLYYACH